MDFVQDVNHLRDKLLDGSFGACSPLFEAAIAGDKDLFINIVQNNSSALEDVAVFSVETPLHIVSGLGHYTIVKELVLRKPGFARELNQDGYSPLHLASAMGHILIVKELLSISEDLCLLKDRYGRTPLHCAAMKGKLDVMKELLESSPKSIMEITTRRETALHVAVVYNHSEAVKLLVDWILQTNNLEVINMKDRGGNTTLHLATSRKQFQTLNILLADNPTINATVEVNATNAGGFTALDIFDVLPQNETDVEMIKVLQRAGSLRARDITKPITHNNGHEILIDCKSKLYKPSYNTTESIRTIQEPPTNGNHVMLLIFTMMATITYCAALCPPGSTLKATCECQFNRGSNLQQQNQILNSTGLFILFNSTGFLTSVAMILHLIHDSPLKPWVMISVFSLIGSYMCLIMAVSPNRVLNLLFLASIMVLLAVARVVFILNSLGLKYFQWRCKRNLGI